MENKEIEQIQDDGIDEDNKVLKNPKRGRLFVKNLPFNITEDKLKQAFSKYGEITEVLT